MKNAQNELLGAVLRIDLTGRSHHREGLEPYIGQLVGGRAVGSKILHDELTPGVDPLGPENILIFNNGPLSGTAAPGSGRGNWAEARAPSSCRNAPARLSAPLIGASSRRRRPGRGPEAAGSP